MELSRGSSGPAVARLQEALLEAGFMVDVDGNFGDQTERAVLAFQSEQGLLVDGIVGQDTVAGLGLGSGSETEDPAPVTNVVFEPSETFLPDFVRERIALLVFNLKGAVNQTLDSAELAVDNFETTMQFSSNNSDTSVPSALMADVLRAIADQVTRRVTILVPTFDQALGFAGGLFGTVADNLAKAGARAERNAAGAWIRSQRAVLDAARHDFTGIRLAHLAENLELEYLASQDKDSMFNGIVEAADQLLVDPRPSMSDFLIELYEGWINEHFSGVGEEAPGCIEFRYEFDDFEFDLVSCTVEAPFGSAIEAGLNELFQDGLVPRAPRPIALRTRKRACFRVDNVNPGGKSWVCGWLDEQGDELSRPINDIAEQAFDHPFWRNQARFVRSAD